MVIPEHHADRLTDLGLKPYATESFALPYGPEDLGLANILARVPGENPDMAPILLGAHYDTCGDNPGADDNAAAVAILLGVAEIFQQTRPNRPRSRCDCAGPGRARRPRSRHRGSVVHYGRRK